MTIRHIHTKAQTGICNSELCTSRAISLNYAPSIADAALRCTVRATGRCSTCHEIVNVSERAGILFAFAPPDLTLHMPQMRMFPSARVPLPNQVSHIMMTTISSMDLLVIQGSNASTRPATTQNPNPATNQDIDRAARDFSEAIRNRVQERVNEARIQRAAQKGVTVNVQGDPVVAPTPPAEPVSPRVFTIQGPDGPTTITIPPRAFDNTIPPQAVDITVAFFLMLAVIIIGLPLARAFARRMDRKSSASPQVSGEISSQLAHLSQSVDAIALEVERISEGQRFTTRLLSEQKQSLPTGTGR